MNKITLGSVKSITLKEIMKLSDAEMNVVCDALFNDDYNDEWFEQAGRESNRETLLSGKHLLPGEILLTCARIPAQKGQEIAERPSYFSFLLIIL